VATPVSDTSGNFTVAGVEPGIYNVRVKQAQSISVEAAGVIFPGLGPQVPVTRNFGTLPTGDTNNDDQVDIVDFSLLRAAFSLSGQTCGTANPPVVPCADYDASGVVDIVDFSLLRRMPVVW
jgi:hypothetical protein